MHPTSPKETDTILVCSVPSDMEGKNFIDKPYSYHHALMEMLS